ncbi:MAG: hypothetical protein R6V56_05225 [Lentisphaeria bacterium]
MSKADTHEIPVRDPRCRYWVQSTRKELEGKLGTTFSLSNGMLGLRGAHEECPDWGRPEFYVAGTYAAGPPALLGFHDPDHILTHPDRITDDALTNLGEDAIQTLPNLPFPIGLKLAVAETTFSFDSHKILSAERLLEMDNSMLRRTLVFRDEDNRRTRVDSCRFVSMADPNLICLQARVRRLNHDAPVEIHGFLHEEVSNTNGVQLWHPGKRLEESGIRGLECVTRGTDIAIAVVQCEHLINHDEEIAIELFAVAGDMPLADARRRAEAARDSGFDACAAAHQESYHHEMRGGRVEIDGNPSTVQGFNFGQLHLHTALGAVADKAGLPIKGLTGHGYRFLTFWDMDFHMFPYYLLTKPRQARQLLEYRYHQLPQYRDNARRWGAEGAQVPWETGARGEEETAPWLCLQEREIHMIERQPHRAPVEDTTRQAKTSQKALLVFSGLESADDVQDDAQADERDAEANGKGHVAHDFSSGSGVSSLCAEVDGMDRQCDGPAQFMEGEPEDTALEKDAEKGG